MSRSRIRYIVIIVAAVILTGGAWTVFNFRNQNTDTVDSSLGEGSDFWTQMTDGNERAWQLEQERLKRLNDPVYARSAVESEIYEKLSAFGYCPETLDQKQPVAINSMVDQFSEQTGVPRVDLAIDPIPKLEVFRDQISEAGPYLPTSVREKMSGYTRYTVPWRVAANSITGCWFTDNPEGSTWKVPFLSIWTYRRGVEFTHGETYGDLNSEARYDRHTFRLLASPGGARPLGLDGIFYTTHIYQRLDDGRLLVGEAGCEPDREAIYYQSISCPDLVPE